MFFRLYKALPAVNYKKYVHSSYFGLATIPPKAIGRKS